MRLLYLFFLIQFATNASTIVSATAWGYSSDANLYDHQTSDRWASAHVQGYFEDGSDWCRLDVEASADEFSARAYNNSYSTNNLLFGGGAVAQVSGIAKIVGGSGPLYLRFIADASPPIEYAEGRVTFSAFGQPVLSAPDPILFSFNQPFDYSFSVAVYISTYEETYIKWAGVEVTDESGNIIPGARLVTGAEAEAPEPATSILALTGILLAARRRFRARKR